jgi:hypothetical protein
VDINYNRSRANDFGGSDRGLKLLALASALASIRASSVFWHRRCFRHAGWSSSPARARVQAQEDAKKKAAELVAKKKTKQGFCKENPQTKDTYKYDVPPFYPKQYVDMGKTFWGDSVNPGHLFTVKSTAPGLVYNVVCRHDSTHEEITYCGKDQDALGGDTKVAEIQGWINGEGGPTYMAVFYQMPCEVPDDTE